MQLGANIGDSSVRVFRELVASCCNCVKKASVATKSAIAYFRCKGNYYGRQCELDGEVVAVAIGASVAAIIIIILTLTCLCMWR